MPAVDAWTSPVDTVNLDLRTGATIGQGFFDNVAGNELFLYNRRVVELTNNSGGTVNAGDVVVIDTAHDASFTTSVIADDPNVIGAAVETIANGAVGKITMMSAVDKISASAAVTRGNWLSCSGSAKTAHPTTVRNAGSFAIALETTGGSGLVKALQLGPLPISVSTLTVASAATMALNSQRITVTGTTTSTDLTTTMPTGTEIVLTFQSAAMAITSGNHWKLLANFVSVANGELRGVVDGSGNFVESFRSPGQGIKALVFRGTAALSAGTTNNTTGTYADITTTVTTPTILTGDVVRLICPLLMECIASSGSSYAMAVADRGGTKVPNTGGSELSTAVIQPGSATALTLGLVFWCEDSPTAGSTYAYKMQVYNSSATSAIVDGITNNPFVVEVWR